MKIPYQSIGLLLFLFFSVSSCATYIQFTTKKSAEPRYSGIYKIAINQVILSDRAALTLRDNQGNWKVSKQKIDDDELTTLVRRSLVSNLGKFSDYQVFDLEDMRKFNQAYQRLRPVSGERIGDLDLIIDIKVAYYATAQSGESKEVMTFRQKKSVKQGDEWVPTQDASYQKVVTVPYDQSNADLICFVEVIKTKNGASNVLKSFNTILSYQSSSMRTTESMVNELAVVITSQILKNVSKYSVITKRQIDTGSDKEVIELMESANLEKASRLLEKTLSDTDEKDPADLYNLGICYEAMGDPGIALQMYREAHQLDESKQLYMTAIGEIE